MSLLDVLVVGAGPAGLSAALMLGRCRRRVVVCDSGMPRNAASRALHGYLTRDGMPPEQLLALGREELRRYGVELRSVRVEAVRSDAGGGGFRAELADGTAIGARLVLIATGVRDRLPDVPGVADCYGRSVFHCPYCDGWEWRDRRIAVFGRGRSGAALALSLQTWSGDVALFTDGPPRLTEAAAGQLRERGIPVRAGRLDAVEHERGLMTGLRLRGGELVARDALFFTTGQAQQTSFAEALGCEVNRKGTIRTDRFGQTCVDGVYVVGDASHDVQFISVAAAEGAKAAVAINHRLQAAAGQVVAAVE